MRIAVIGAFGKAGSLIAEEAISRRHAIKKYLSKSLLK